MNTLKRISAIVLALVMVLSLGVTVFADANQPAKYTITVTPATNSSANPSYKAYQIFKGTLSDGVLVDIEWGTGIDKLKIDDMLTALKKVSPFKEDTEFVEMANSDITAADVANVLGKVKGATDTTVMPAIADIFAAAKSNDGAELTKVEETNNYAANVDEGYYLIIDETESDDVGEGKAKSRYMIGVNGNVTIAAKADAPHIDKVIDDGSDNGVDQNTAGIGDTVKYKITSEVPDMTGYNKYIFVVRDKLSKGLTLDIESLKVTVGDDDADYRLKINDKEYEDIAAVKKAIEENSLDLTGETTIEIIFMNFEKHTSGEAVVVTYNATVNDAAVRTQDGNPNDVQLVYSNDPNTDYTGDYPDDDNPTGETPWDRVITYTTELELDKIDAETSANLTGAEFDITGTKWNAVLVKGVKYTLNNEEGTYYLLKDGSYTLTPPEGDDEKYASTTDKYVREEYEEVETTGENVLKHVTVNDGSLILEDLGPGDFTITETKAPNGYNKLEDNIYVHIEAVTSGDPNGTDHAVEWKVWYAVAKEKPNWTNEAEAENNGWTALGSDQIQQGTKTQGEVAGTDSKITYKVLNNKGAQLPGTGGMGTTIFYIVGGLMLIIALAVCVSKVLAPSKVKSTKIAAENN